MRLHFRFTPNKETVPFDYQDIAFEFSSWMNHNFKKYLLKELKLLFQYRKIKEIIERG